MRKRRIALVSLSVLVLVVLASVTVILFPMRESMGAKEMAEKGLIDIGPDQGHGVMNGKLIKVDKNGITVNVKNSDVNLLFVDKYGVLLIHKTDYRPLIEKEVQNNPGKSAGDVEVDFIRKAGYSVDLVFEPPEYIRFAEKINLDVLKQEIGRAVSAQLAISNDVVKVDALFVDSERP
jgi:hypothetical protein